jgi:hypothetical protein
VHGGADNYIRPEMARALHDLARPPKELWLVEGAKHNQSLQVAGDDYRKRVLEFFTKHLEGLPRAGAGANGDGENSGTGHPDNSLVPPLLCSSNSPSRGPCS